MSLPVVYQIPAPPTVNTIYRNVPGRGRVKTARYNTWRRAGLNELDAQGAALFDQPCIVSLSVPSSKTGDIDNRIKAALDLLVEAGVLKDDSKKYVREVRAKWVPSYLPCQVSLTATNE